jgi:hypothetical protein
MSRAFISAALVLATVFWAAGPVSAQQTSTAVEAEASPSSSVVTTAPSNTESREAWLQEDLAEAMARSRRTRNALIGTSVAFGIGVILAGIGRSQCEKIQTGAQYGDLACNTAGNVLLPLGGTMAALGGIGMLTSGIMLGKSNQTKRQIERDIRRIQYGRRLQWDIASGGLVF